MDLEKTATTFGFVTAFAALAIGIVCLIQCINSDGRIDYCRIVHENTSYVQVYRIIGHRKWRSDVNVAVTISAEDAAFKMQTLCPR